MHHERTVASRCRGSCDAYGRRNGFAAEEWEKQEQKYEGSFVRDAFHGEGTYEWFTGRRRLVFEGHFYSNFKEGYGVVSLPDGSVFEGLFSNNRPFGPGVKTHANGRQDVGFWVGNRIVRLSRTVDCIIPRVASTSAGKLKLLRFQAVMPVWEKDADVGGALLTKHGLDPSQSSRLYSDQIQDPRSMFFDRPNLDRVCFKKVNVLDSISRSSEERDRSGVSSPGDGPLRKRPPPSKDDDKHYCSSPGGTPPVDLFRCHAAGVTLNRSPISFPGDAEADATGKATRPLGVAADTETERGSTQLVSWNRTDLCMEMLKQIFRFRSFEERLSFKISDLMSGARTKFRKTGETERLNLHFLRMCSIGPAYVVKELLCSKSISEAVTDARGNNSVMFAAATDQHDVIEVLLNYGADVNSFNDENLTPLNLCLLRRIAEAESLGNWEHSFLPPDASPSDVEGVKKTWRAVESTTSLDRIFGDGTSAYITGTLREIREFSEHDSIFCFGDDDDPQDSGSVTLLRFKTNEVSNDAVIEKSVSQPKENRDDTVKMDRGMCPKSFKREEYLRSVAEPTERDKYFFQLNVSKRRREEVEGRKSSVTGVVASVPSQEQNSKTHKYMNIPNDRIVHMERTIEQLLRRGADPNLGDAPKPSLHLAVYSGEPKLVRLLLTYGAAPDSHTLPQEGLLTPLHVLVLLQPGDEHVAMCQLLLNYGASPEEETAPNFSPPGECDFVLDPKRGRTPLQLLCTRQDAEEVDPEGFLSQLALLLAGVSATGNLFRGHSYLTLAMISGNYALVKALLASKRIDPNEVLGRGLGTALHVLVSAELQKRTPFENSIRMCDLLLERGANPSMRFRSPRSLAGTCIDYGYREIQRERNGSDSMTVKPSGRQYLEEHVRVVEYLEKRARTIHGDEKGKEQNIKPRLGIRGDEKKNWDSKSAKTDSGASVTGTVSREREGKREREKEEREGEAVGLEETSKILGSSLGDGIAETGRGTMIIEIKKRVVKGAITRKRGGKEDSAGKEGRKKSFAKAGNVTGKMKEITRSRDMSKDKRCMRNTKARSSEKLPERFRQSLLHMFGICGERFDFNDFLLPYAVLRNGDLYYRFIGRKPTGTEQYSLI